MDVPVSKSVIKVVELIPTITLGIIVLAFFNLYSSYSFYGIDISSFIDGTEIIFSFSSLLYSVCLITVSAIFVYTVTEYIDPFFNWVKKLKWYFKLLGAVATLGFQLALSMAFILFLFGFTFNNLWVDLLPLIVILLIYMLAKITNPSLSVQLWLTFFICIVFIHYRNWEDYRRIVVNKKPRFDVTVAIGSRIIQSSEDLIYINSTRKYVFFWIPSKGSVQSYSLDNVDSFVIKNLDIPRNNLHR